MNKTDMVMHAHVRFISRDKEDEGRMRRQCIFVITETTKLCSKVAVPVCIPKTMYERSNC